MRCLSYKICLTKNSPSRYKVLPGHRRICNQTHLICCVHCYGPFVTHSATRIFVPPNRQNRSIRHSTGSNQLATQRIFCTPSSPVHATFTFMAEQTCQNRFFNELTRGLCICNSTSYTENRRKFDNNSATLSVSPRAFSFSGVFSTRRMRHNANHVTVSMFALEIIRLTHKNTSYISITISAECRDKGNILRYKPTTVIYCTLPHNW